MHCTVCSLSPVPSWGPGVTLASVHHRPQPRSRPSFVAAPSRASWLAELPSRDRAAANSSRAAEPGGGECSVPGRGGSTCSSWNIWLPSTEIQSKIWNEYCNSCIWGHSSRGTDECVVNELGDNPELELVSGSGHITSHSASTWRVTLSSHCSRCSTLSTVCHWGYY